MNPLQFLFFVQRNQKELTSSFRIFDLLHSFWSYITLNTSICMKKSLINEAWDLGTYGFHTRKQLRFDHKGTKMPIFRIIIAMSSSSSSSDYDTYESISFGSGSFNLPLALIALRTYAEIFG